MTSLSELDFFDCCWLVLFLLVALPCSFLGLVIVGGNVLPMFLLIFLLVAASWLLLLGLSKWRNWLSRLLLTLIVSGVWFLLAGSIWSHFRNFC